VTEGTDWVEQARRLVAGLGLAGLGQGGPGEGDGHVPGGDCRWCPVCQLAAVARRPEVSEALADALTSAAIALRAVAAAAQQAAAEQAEEQAAGRGGDQAAGTPPPPAAPVQRIEIA
jgi:hypothetical protein